MTDTATTVAFDTNAPKDERSDALGELQKAHLPSVGELLPPEPIQRVIDAIQASYEEQDFLKSISQNVVPFPSNRVKRGKEGMQSVFLDEFSVPAQGEYWERPSSMSFDALRTMVDQTPVLNAVVFTRVRQVMRFCRVSNKNTNLPGFEIAHVDREHQLNDSDAKNINELQRFFLNCGWEFRPRRRKALRRDSFAQFCAKIARDSLTLDSAPIETEWKNDKGKGIDGFYAVDGGTIRLCTEDGYAGDDEIFALQVVQGNIRAAYSFEDLIYEARNPRTDVRSCGYGLSETELLVRVVTGWLNALTYNIKGFDSNSIPKGMLHLTGNYSKADLDAFKRYWNNMIRGVNNAWTLPIIVSPDQESKASFENFGIEFNEMYFGKWMTFLTSVICAIYGMSPAEINFDSFTGGNTSALAGSDTGEKLAASKDSGLRPLLGYLESTFTDFIVADFSDQYCFRWTGLDPEDADKKHEIRKLVLTVNELRAEEGYDAMESEMVGNAPLNPSLMGAYMQENAPEPEEAGAPVAKSISAHDWWASKKT